MVGPQDTYEAGPNGNEVLGPNPGTNILTTNHIYVYPKPLSLPGWCIGNIDRVDICFAKHVVFRIETNVLSRYEKGFGFVSGFIDTDVDIFFTTRCNSQPKGTKVEI